MAQKSIPDHIQYRNRVLLGGRDVTPDPAKDLGSMKGSETPGDLLLNLRHSKIPFRLVVVERYPEIEHEVERLRPVPMKSFQQVSRFGLFRSAPLALGRWPGFKKRILLVAEGDGAAIA